MAREVIEGQSDMLLFTAEVLVNFFEPLFKKFRCHPCSLVVAVSKAVICNLLLPKTSWPLRLPNVKYWPLHSSCLVTHEQDCDAELI